MSIYKTPKSFPGVDKLPPLVRVLMERVFPPDEVPLPGSVVFRSPKDLTKLLPMESVVPQTPRKALDDAMRALEEFKSKRHTIDEKIRSLPQSLWKKD